MALVAYEVIGRTLLMSHGLTVNVGERLGLDPSQPEHASIIQRGWVRKCPPSLSVESPSTVALTTQPNKQVRRRGARRKRSS
jgi:hypothetical protein